MHQTRLAKHGDIELFAKLDMLDLVLLYGATTRATQEALCEAYRVDHHPSDHSQRSALYVELGKVEMNVLDAIVARLSDLEPDREYFYRLALMQTLRTGESADKM